MYFCGIAALSKGSSLKQHLKGILSNSQRDCHLNQVSNVARHLGTHAHYVNFFFLGERGGLHRTIVSERPSAQTGMSISSWQAVSGREQALTVLGSD